MATGPYDDAYRAEGRRELDAPRERSVGELVFIWIAWALAAAFWGMTMTTIMGIVRSVMAPGPGVTGNADAGGIAWVLIDVVGGLVLLGLAMAYGAWMFAHRNRALDPVGEAATAELYDRSERREAEQTLRRSPERERLERDLR